MSDNVDMDQTLWSVMMDHPPPRSDALCRDLYDQARWVTDHRPMVTVRASILWPPLVECREHLDPLPLLVEARKSATLMRLYLEFRLSKEFGWSRDYIGAMYEKIRDYHLFSLEQTKMQIDGDVIFRIPPAGKDRITGLTAVAHAADSRHETAIHAMMRRYQ